MRPNICVVVLDAARASNFSCYGHARPTTPTMDDLAAESIVFDRAYAPTGVTIDSIASLLSGLYPAEHQSGRAGAVTVDTRFLPEALSEIGYRTGAVTCNPFISPPFGFDRGFDQFSPVTQRFERGMNMRKFFSETNTLPASRRYLKFLVDAADRDFLYHLGNALQFKFGLFTDSDDGAAQATRQSQRFIESRETPWFLYVHYTETHMNSAGDLPYSVPEASRYRFVDSSPDPDRFHTRSGPVDYDEETRTLHERLYDGALRYLDTRVGDLIASIKAADQWERTVFVVTADHGELLGEHDRLGHGVLYEPAIHVPLILNLPEGSVAPRRVHDRVTTLGLYRTIAELVDLDVLPPRGESLLASPSQSVLVQDYSDTWEWSRYGEGTSGQNALYRGAMKLILSDEPELFDLAADPAEEQNLADARPETLRELRTDLDRRLEALDIASPAGAEFDVSEQTERRLSELGYLE